MKCTLGSCAGKAASHHNNLFTWLSFSLQYWVFLAASCRMPLVGKSKAHDVLLVAAHGHDRPEIEICAHVHNCIN